MRPLNFIESATTLDDVRDFMRAVGITKSAGDYDDYLDSGRIKQVLKRWKAALAHWKKDPASMPGGE